MTGEQQTAFIAWRATLSRQEQDEVDYICTMQGGDHATAYLAVRMLRLEQRSVFRDAVKAIGAVGGVLLAMVAGYKGAR